MSPAVCDETLEVRLVPDRYTVVYEFQPEWPAAAQAVWPVARGAIATLDVSGDAAVTIDIPRALLTLEPTLREAALTAITTSVTREQMPRVDLHPADGTGFGPDIPLYTEESGGTYTPTAETIATLPGTYAFTLSGSTLPGLAGDRRRASDRRSARRRASPVRCLARSASTSTSRQVAWSPRSRASGC